MEEKSTPVFTVERGKAPVPPVRHAPLDGGWGWMVVLGACISTMLTAGMIVRAAGIIFVAVREYYGGSAGDTAWINAIMLGILFCCSPIGTITAEKLGTRYALFFSGGFVSVGFITSQFVREVQLLYLTISVLVGFGGSFCFVPVISHVNKYFDKRQSLAAGLTMSGGGLGAMIAGPITNALLQEYSLPGTFLILGGIFLHYFVCGMLMRPLEFYEPKLKKQKLSTKLENGDLKVTGLAQGHANPAFQTEEEVVTTDTAHAPDSDTTITPPGGGDKKPKAFDIGLLRHGVTWLFSLCFMFGYMGLFNTNSFIPPHVSSIGLGDADYALLVSLMGGIDIPGRILAGWLLDLHLVHPGVFFVVFVGLGGVLVCMMPLVGPNLPALAGICGAFALCISFLPPLQTPVGVKLLGKPRLPSTLGIAHFFYGIPFLFSQPVAGVIFDQTGSWASGFYMSGGAMALGAVMMAAYVISWYKTSHKRILNTRL